MSRNKLIKFVHDYTGKTYAECRQICKLGHWNEKDILLYLCVEPELLKTISKSAENLGAAFNDIAAAICDVGAKTAAIMAEMFENCAASMRKTSERMRAAAAVKDTFDVNKDVFNYEETITASILNPSEVRKQFGLEPIDVNDPHTPVFAPYYARAIPNGKLYQNDGRRVTGEITGV